MSHALITSLVDETLRWTSPVRHFMRTATADTELRGIPLDAGARMMLLYASANRDEDAFENAESFVIERKPNRHLAFFVGGLKSLPIRFEKA